MTRGVPDEGEDEIGEGKGDVEERDEGAGDDTEDGEDRNATSLQDDHSVPRDLSEAKWIRRTRRKTKITIHKKFAVNQKLNSTHRRTPFPFPPSCISAPQTSTRYHSVVNRTTRERAPAK